MELEKIRENQATSHYGPGMYKVCVLLKYAAFWNCLLLCAETYMRNRKETAGKASAETRDYQ